MKLKNNLLVYATFTAVLSACNPAKSPAPEIKIPAPKLTSEYEEFIKSTFTCDKTDIEMGLAQLDLAKPVVIRDTIESKNTVVVECDKKESPVGIRPVRNMSQMLTVEVPEGLKEKVNFVRIGNARTCVDIAADAQDDRLLEEIRMVVDGESQVAVPAPTITTLGESGRLKIRLTDSIYKFLSVELNVFEKNNIISIKYYGSCLKYKDKVDDKKKDSHNCEEAQLLAEKQFPLSVLIERPVVEGVRKVDGCFKK